MTKQELMEQMEERFAEWLEKDVLPFYESNIKNPEVVGKEMSFPFDDGIALTIDDVDYEFSNWLDEIYEDQFVNFHQSWAYDYTDVSLKAIDIKLRDEDYAELEDSGYKNLQRDFGYDCVLKVIMPAYDLHEKEVSVRFEIKFIVVKFNEPIYDKHNRMDDPFADHGDYDWKFIDEKYYEKIKEALESLDYLDTPYADRYYQCSNWETPCFDDPEITKEHVTEDYAGIDPYDYDDDDEECPDENDNDAIIEDIGSTIMDWFLERDVDDKCRKICENLKYLEEDEVLKLEIQSGDDFVLDYDELDYIFQDCYDEWWEHHDYELGRKEFSEFVWACKCLDCPELDYDYDKENKILTIRATFSVYYCGHIEDDAMDSDYAEECYENDACYSDYDDDEHDDGCWWDGYSSEDAFWECNGI